MISLQERARAREPDPALADLAALYAAHHEFVWRVLVNLGVPRSAVEDAVQDVFLVMHRRRDELEDRGAPRGLLFGIKDGWRRRGIDALLAHETFKNALKLGYQGGELGWAMEDDTLVNRMLQTTGAKHVKTFRVYERAL